MRFILRRNHSDLAEDKLTELAEAMARKRVVVEVRADKVISWDHRKLA